MAKSRRQLALLIACMAVGIYSAAAINRRAFDTSGAIQAALERLDKGDLAAAERSAMSVATRPEEPAWRAWLIVASARQRAGRYASALRAYRLFLTSCSSNSLREYVLKQMDTCRGLLRPPTPVVPAAARLTDDDLRELAKVSPQVSTESTEHFVIRAPNARLAKLLASLAENALKRICHNILGGQDYPHSVDVYIWKDRKTYLQHATDAPEWAGGNFTLSTSGGNITRRIDLTQRDENGEFDVIVLDRILPHELCHLVVHEYFGDATCPLFLDEAMSMLAEARIDSRRIELAGAAIASDGKIPLAELIVRDRQSIGNPSVFYAESLSFVRYIRSRITREQFKTFIECVKQGCTISDALQRGLYVTRREDFLNRLSEKWEGCALAEAQFLRALRETETLKPSRPPCR